MSQSGNQGPYKPNPYSPGPYGPNPYQSQQSGVGGPYQPPFGNTGPNNTKSGSKVGWIIGIVLASVGLLFLCCCGGFAALAFWGNSQTTDEIADKIRDNPTLRTKIGELESLSVLWMESGGHEDPDVFIYNAKGSTGEAKLHINWVYDDDLNVIIVWAKIVDERGNENTFIH